MQMLENCGFANIRGHQLSWILLNLQFRGYEMLETYYFNIKIHKIDVR